MSTTMISLTDYHVSRTLGYIDVYVQFTDAIGGTATPGPIQVPLTPDIQAIVSQLDTALSAAVQTELLKRPGADPTLTVVPFVKPQGAPSNG